MEAKERPWDFRWSDLKEDHLIADDVLAKMQQRSREFLADAHSSMLGDKEIYEFVYEPYLRDHSA